MLLPHRVSVAVRAASAPDGPTAACETGERPMFRRRRHTMIPKRRDSSPSSRQPPRIPELPAAGEAAVEGGEGRSSLRTAAQTCTAPSRPASLATGSTPSVRQPRAEAAARRSPPPVASGVPIPYREHISLKSPESSSRPELPPPGGSCSVRKCAPWERIPRRSFKMEVSAPSGGPN